MKKKNSLCSIHPKYEAKRRPRARCIPCWQAWYKKQGLDFPIIRDADDANRHRLFMTLFGGT